MTESTLLSVAELHAMKDIASKARGMLPSSMGLCSATRMLALVAQVRSVVPPQDPQPQQREAVARAICTACGERPDHQGDARGREFRWHDYLEVADAAIRALGLPEKISLDRYETAAKKSLGTEAEQMALCSPDNLIVLATYAGRAVNAPDSVAQQRQSVARAITAACEDDPEHNAKTAGLDFRWQDYLGAADAAIAALASPPHAASKQLRQAKKSAAP